MSDQPTVSGTEPSRASGAFSATTDGHRGTPDSIADAVNDVTGRVQGLVREEIELAKAELRAKARTLIIGVVAGTIAGLFAIGALTLILHGLAWFTWWVIPGIPDNQFFWGFFIVAALLLLVGALLAFIAQRAIKKATPPAPTMAIDEAKLIKETVQSPQPATTVPADREVRR